MEYIQFTEFRNQAKKFFDEIEKGAQFIVTWRGRPVAEIFPFRKKSAGWKRPVRKVKLKGRLTTTDIILQERDES